MLYWRNGNLTSNNDFISNLVIKTLRSYYSYDKSNTNILSVFDHMRKIEESCKFLGIKLNYSNKDLIKAIKELLKKNGGGNKLIEVPRFWSRLSN